MAGSPFFFCWLILPPSSWVRPIAAHSHWPPSRGRGEIDRSCVAPRSRRASRSSWRRNQVGEQRQELAVARHFHALDIQPEELGQREAGQGPRQARNERRDDTRQNLIHLALVHAERVVEQGDRQIVRVRHQIRRSHRDRQSGAVEGQIHAQLDVDGAGQPDGLRSGLHDLHQNLRDLQLGQLAVRAEVTGDHRSERRSDVDAHRRRRRQLTELGNQRRQQSRRERQRRQRTAAVDVDGGERGDHQAALGLAAQHLVEPGAGDADTETVGRAAHRRIRSEAREGLRLGIGRGQVRRPGRRDALSRSRSDAHREARVGAEGDAGVVLLDLEERCAQLQADPFAHRSGDRDTRNHRFDGIGDRAVGRAGAVGVAEEALDPADHEALDVGQQRADDVADDRGIAEPRGELVAEPAERHIDRIGHQIDVDVRGIDRVRLHRVVAAQKHRVGGQPQPAIRHQATAVDVHVDAQVENRDVTLHCVHHRVHGQRQVAERRRRVRNHDRRAAQAAEEGVDEAAAGDNRSRRQQRAEIEQPGGQSPHQRLHRIEASIVEAQRHALRRESRVGNRLAADDDDAIADDVAVGRVRQFRQHRIEHLRLTDADGVREGAQRRIERARQHAVDAHLRRARGQDGVVAADHLRARGGEHTVRRRVDEDLELLAGRAGRRAQPPRLVDAAGGAAVAVVDVAVVAFLAGVDVAITAGRLAKTRRAKTGVAGLDGAVRRTAVAVEDVAVVAGLDAVEVAVAAGRHADARLTGAGVIEFLAAQRAGAAVAAHRVVIVAGLQTADESVAADRRTDARLAGAGEARFHLAGEGAAVAAVDVAVVAGLGALLQAVAADRRTDARHSRAQPARLDLADRAAAVAARSVAVVAGLRPLERAVAAGEGADARLARAQIRRFDLAGAGAAVAARLIAVVADLALTGLNRAVAAILRADARCADARVTALDAATRGAAVSTRQIAVVAGLARVEATVAAVYRANARLAGTVPTTLHLTETGAPVAVRLVFVVAPFARLQDAIAAFGAAAAVLIVAVVERVAIAHQPAGIVEQTADLACGLARQASRQGGGARRCARREGLQQVGLGALLARRLRDFGIALQGDAPLAVGLRSGAGAETLRRECRRVGDRTVLQALLLALEVFVETRVLAPEDHRTDLGLTGGVVRAAQQAGVQIGPDRAVYEVVLRQDGANHRRTDGAHPEAGKTAGALLGDLGGFTIDGLGELPGGIVGDARLGGRGQATGSVVDETLLDQLAVGLGDLAHALVEGGDAAALVGRHLRPRRECRHHERRTHQRAGNGCDRAAPPQFRPVRMRVPRPPWATSCFDHVATPFFAALGPEHHNVASIAIDSV